MRLSDAIFAAVAFVFAPRDIVTVLIPIGHSMTAIYLITNLGVELDRVPSAWDKEP